MRIDPISGCNVLTFHEFIHGEAQREGKEPHEVMEEIFNMLEDDNEKMRQEYRTNALKYLQEEAKELLTDWEYNFKSNGEVTEYTRHDKNGQWVIDHYTFDAGERPPQPVTLIEVIDINFSQKMRSSQSKIVAKCAADDGKEYVYTLCRGDYSGSFYEPPDCDVELTWNQV